MIAGWTLRSWLPDPDQPGRGRAIWLAGPAHSEGDGVGRIREAATAIEAHDPTQTLGYLLNVLPTERLIREFAERDLRQERVVTHPAVVALVPLAEALPPN